MSGGTAGEPGRGPETRSPVSVLIAARDEEVFLPGALESVVGWAGEVVVLVDPRTRDRTREVAASGGARVAEHVFASSADQLGWGMTLCRHDWVLVLDADERVSAELARSVAEAVAGPRHPAYAMKRRNLAFGHAMRFGDWGVDRVVRLVDRRDVTLAGGMHWRIVATSSGRLRGTLVHDTLRSLDQYLPKVMDYAHRGAVAVTARRVGGLAVGGRPLWRFLRAYVLRLGFLDGVPGLVVAALGAGGTFLKWALAWEAGATAGPQRP